MLSEGAILHTESVNIQCAAIPFGPQYFHVTFSYRPLRLCSVPQNCIISEEDNKIKLIDLGAAADLRIGINYVPNEYLLDPRYGNSHGA